MYQLSLKPKNENKIFQAQTIYWYPVKVNLHYVLQSIGIASYKSKAVIEDFEDKGSLVFHEKHNEFIYFLYCGSVGASGLFKFFKERPFVVRDGYLFYAFSEIEIEYMYLDLATNNIPQFPKTDYIINFFQILFEKHFQKNWEVMFSYTNYPCKYFTEEISPHPILNLLDCINYYKFSKEYYYKLIVFLLKNGFLTEWDDVDNINKDSLLKIISKCNIISKDEIKNKQNLAEETTNIVTEIFKKFDIFMLAYLASQCGSYNSIIKIFMSKMYSLIPESKKKEVDLSFPKFQPKISVKNIELHFIHTSSKTSELIDIYNELSRISINVKFYDYMRSMILTDKVQIINALRQSKLIDRHRFICTLEIFPPVDYTDLKHGINIISDSVKEILGKDNLIEEMWVKKIQLLVNTPPQFEDDVIFSLWSSWFVKKYPEDVLNKNMDSKLICLDIFCDYYVFKNNEFAFNLDYALDMQNFYSVLNKKLLLEHNFSHFLLDIDTQSEDLLINTGPQIDANSNISDDTEVILEQIKNDFDNLDKEIKNLNLKLNSELCEIKGGFEELSQYSEVEKLTEPLTRLGKFLIKLGDPNSDYNKVIIETQNGIELAQKVCRTYNRFAQWLPIPQVPDLFL